MHISTSESGPHLLCALTSHRVPIATSSEGHTPSCLRAFAAATLCLKCPNTYLHTAHEPGTLPLIHHSLAEALLPLGSHSRTCSSSIPPKQSPLVVSFMPLEYVFLNYGQHVALHYPSIIDEYSYSAPPW